MLRQGRISRRDLMLAAAALGITGATVDPATAQAEAPLRGGSLRIGLSSASTTDRLDPVTWRAEFMHTVGPQLYDPLVRLDENVTPHPALAASWEAKPGAREWVFKLRKGVTFHNGKTMTAADVVYSINRHRGTDSRSIAKSMLAPLTEIKATAADEITIALGSGNADLPYIMADLHLAIGPEGSTFTEDVGTGAFMLESFEPGVRVQVKRYPNDYRSDRGYVDSVENIGINDSAARISALLSGSVDLINKVDPHSVEPMQKNPEIQFFNISGGSRCMFVMACDAPPYDNLDLRLAMKYAIDREAILKTVQRGYGAIGNDHPIASFDPAYAADIPQWPYDPDKAKFHLEKSGYKDPVVLDVADIAFSGATECAQVYQASAKKAGIDLQINRVPNDGYWDKVWMKRPFTAASWSGRPTADITLTTEYASDASLNDSHWRRPKFDEILVEARAELDQAKRRQMYRELELMIHDDGGTVIPMFFNNLDAGSKKLRGFKLNPVAQMSNYRAPEMLWFAS
jgi:peptide/nickel transport system substrate-binding protein